MILAPGIHVYIYNEFGSRTERRPLGLYSSWPDPARCADDLVGLGARGVIVHGVCAVPAWLTPATEATFRNRGLDVAIGIGSRGPGKWQLFADGLIAALNRGVGVVADAEGSWDHGAHDAAARVTARVLAAVPDAPARCTAVPWWAPNDFVDGNGRHHVTHPDYPYLEFAPMTPDGLYVQAYGLGEGEALRELAWARHPSQYDAIARRGNRAPWTVGAIVESHLRTMNDHVHTFMAESASAIGVWHYNRTDPACALGMKVAKALRAHGFTGGEAVRTFQASAGLTPDGIVGPKSLGALGLAGLA